MKLYIFGSCSGTEPMPGRHHTAIAFEINGRIYWFDAGENCSYTAHLMGVDLLSVTDIFISHPHMDHVGGLGNLLWNIRKLTTVKKCSTRFGDVTVHTPVMETFDGVLSILRNTEGNYACKHGTIGHLIEDGVVFKNCDLTVTALHNTHLPPVDGAYRSFSFLIEAEGTRIIYSGDVGGISDMEPLFSRGCDLLLMETGHHLPEVVCEKIKSREYPIKSVRFLHQGPPVLKDFVGSLERSRAIIPSATLSNDGDVVEI